MARERILITVKTYPTITAAVDELARDRLAMSLAAGIPPPGGTFGAPPTAFAP